MARCQAKKRRYSRWPRTGIPALPPRRLRGTQITAGNKACLCWHARRQAGEGTPSNTVMAVL